MASTTQFERSGKQLTPAVLHVLLALADGPSQGYAIMRAAQQTAGSGAA